jgi:hypothetical protein
MPGIFDTQLTRVGTVMKDIIIITHTCPVRDMQEYG